MPVSRGIRATSTTHATYRLTAQERQHVGWLVWMMRTSHRLGRRWTMTSIAQAYGISRKTAADCYEREFGV